MTNNTISRGRPAHVTPAVSRHIRIPAGLATELDLHLYSEVEGRIPYGALGEFITQACRELLDKIYGKQAAGMRHIPGED